MEHNFFRYVVVAFVTLATVIGQHGGRELRPSDHGLAYQEDSPPPVQNDDAQEMMSFFGSTTPSVPLPEAQNISGTWWSVHGHGEGRPRDVRRDHVKMVLLVASAVCGLTGVVLMAVSGIVFLFRLQKQKPKAEIMASTSASTSVPHAASDK
ncbi:hypothetical protein BUALT_Bualt03G0017700 [Buddleja alternifolia]|uniref:Uncharacterized protein n=1 Tax=Buddleja alternifolia TaxID=168488 RepID=A0AAV6XQB8_9LAMI|nr:hypothetical protein BUALT_Bualt03G0002900 [Buddleja alternifolia]KAG8385206.1 hypothetical protein BUALT_Bualt03G0017700 [Buddleja alternifolia]